MKTFEWNANFQTDLPAVDHQHRHLVDLINALGEQLNRGNRAGDELDALFRQLLEYAGYHFSEEEALMKAVGLDRRHVQLHEGRHRDFIEKLLLLKDSAPGNLGSVAEELLEYLIHWLTYHILGQDQNMARQIDAIRSGQDPETAYDREERREDLALEPLLSAVNGLLARLSSQNERLKELNQSLEQRVDERTRQLALANRKLELLSLTDELTGLPNRRHAIQQLEAIWKETARGPVTALMIDADYFKEVNDQYGHDAGDVVLVELARTLGNSVRTDDRVYRLGGDEFLVLCPETGSEGAQQVAEQLARRVTALDVVAGCGRWRGSVSIGVATTDPSISSYSDLLKAADDALYRSKRAGRGCIRSTGQASGKRG
jgi:hemerythrin